MKITVREPTLEDAPAILSYWYDSSPDFLEGMGVDFSKLPSREEFQATLEQKFKSGLSPDGQKLNVLIVCADENAVGFHTLSPFTEGESGVFHAHIWDKSMRGKGIAVESYPLACRAFIEKFRLKKVLFKTPIQNKGALRIKAKLGLEEVGEEALDFGIYKAGIKAKVFEFIP